jgi:hypothetical protein
MILSIIQKADGGYMAAALSNSSQTGSVTQTNHSTNRDTWVLQLDASGNIVPLTGH